MTKHIAVLKGGWSAEREVSLRSGAACAEALRSLGYRVSEIDVQRDIAEILARMMPDVVFNALHGNYGEDGCIQGILEILEIPYTHSGVLASALAMDKPMAKKIFEAAGLLCPKGVTLPLSELLKGDPLPRPFVVKPASEGSSVGVYIVSEEDNRPLSMLLEGEKNIARLYLVEEYIPGQELTVAVLDGQPLGVTEIKTHSGFYDYTNKYTDGKTEHICPADLPKAEYESVMQMAVVAHKALGCRGLSRADFRYDSAKILKEGTLPSARQTASLGSDLHNSQEKNKNYKGNFYLLEVNTQPGMTALSLSPELAAYAGISFNALVERLIQSARLGN